jgi:hypothetical protein
MYGINAVIASFLRKMQHNARFYSFTPPNMLLKCRTELKSAVAIGWCAPLRLRWDFWGIIYSTMEGNMDINLLNMLHVFKSHHN